MTIKSISITSTSKSKNERGFLQQWKNRIPNWKQVLGRKGGEKRSREENRKKNKTNYEDDAWEEETQDKSIILECRDDEM